MVQVVFDDASQGRSWYDCAWWKKDGSMSEHVGSQVDSVDV